MVASLSAKNVPGETGLPDDGAQSTGLNILTGLAERQDDRPESAAVLALIDAMRAFTVALEIKSVLFQYSDYLPVRHTVGVITNRARATPLTSEARFSAKSIRETLEAIDSRTRSLKGALRFKN